MLNKLVEISTGKWSCVPTKEHMSRDFRSVDPAIRFSMNSYKSLNLPFRKRETDRIERENHAFAKRLFDRPANLSKKKLEVEYKDHQKYLKQIQKMKATQIGSFAIAAGLTLSPTNGYMSAGGMKQYSKNEHVQPRFTQSGTLPPLE